MSYGDHPAEIEPRSAEIRVKDGVRLVADGEVFQGVEQRGASITPGWVHLVGKNALQETVSYSIPSRYVETVMWKPRVVVHEQP